MNNKSYYVVYGEGTYGPFKDETAALLYANKQEWGDFQIFDNHADAQTAHEIECDR